MIEKKTMAQLLERLSGLQWFPRDNPAAIKDLGEALRLARTDEIAVLVADYWIKSFSEAPKPADLYGLIKVENEKFESAHQPQSVECAICNGTGQEIVERSGYTGARPCVCRKGAVA